MTSRRSLSLMRSARIVADPSVPSMNKFSIFVALVDLHTSFEGAWRLEAEVGGVMSVVAGVSPASWSRFQALSFSLVGVFLSAVTM